MLIVKAGIGLALQRFDCYYLLHMSMGCNCFKVANNKWLKWLERGGEGEVCKQGAYIS